MLPNASSAAKLAAGNSLRPHRPNDHREDRPGLADPSRLPGARGEQPFAGVDRRRPASVRAREEEGGMDWSNLTSGPPGPTVSDPSPVHVGEVEAHFQNAPSMCTYIFETFSSLFLFK